MNAKIQNPAHVARHVFFVGQSGTGKTTLAFQTVRKTPARWKFVFDTKSGQVGHTFKLPTCVDPEQLASAVARGGWVCFNPVFMFPGRLKEGLAFFCDFVWEISTSFKGRKILFVDELQMVQPRGKACAELQIILDAGRTFELDTFHTSAAPNRIHCDIRSQVTEVFAFRQVDGAAKDFLAEDCRINPDEVTTLKSGEYVWKNTSTGETARGGKPF